MVRDGINWKRGLCWFYPFLGISYRLSTAKGLPATCIRVGSSYPYQELAWIRDKLLGIDKDSLRAATVFQVEITGFILLPFEYQLNGSRLFSV
jgi:hypothetical protein